MILRSTSTPSLGSPVGSFAVKHAAASGQISFPKSLPNSPEKAAADNILRRAQSAGNLEEGFVNGDHDLMSRSLSRQSSRRLSRKTTLETIPSLYPSGDEEEEEEEEEEEVVVGEGGLNPLNLARELIGLCDMMYLAAGIGVNAAGLVEECGAGGEGGGGGGSGGGNRVGDGNYNNYNNREGGDSMEDHYKNMLLESPANPLFLRNYAHFLYQTKGDLVGADEHYSRAIIADPGDAEILCEYAKLIWELHHDKDRAASYFQRALKADPQDSHINACYASFLWDIEQDEDEEDGVQENSCQFFHQGIMASATA